MDLSVLLYYISKGMAALLSNETVNGNDFMEQEREADQSSFKNDTSV